MALFWCESVRFRWDVPGIRLGVYLFGLVWICSVLVSKLFGFVGILEHSIWCGLFLFVVLPVTCNGPIARVTGGRLWLFNTIDSLRTDKLSVRMFLGGSIGIVEHASDVQQVSRCRHEAQIFCFFFAYTTNDVYFAPEIHLARK